MRFRTEAAATAAAMMLVACGGGTLAFSDLSRAEQLAFDVFDELGTGMSEPELACVVRAMNDDDALLPRDADDLPDVEVSAFASSDVEDCVEDTRDLGELVATVRAAEATPEEEPEEEVADDPAEQDDDADLEEEVEDPDQDAETDDEGAADDGEATDIGSREFFETRGDAATLTELSPALRAAVEGSDLEGLVEALELPAELVPSGNVIVYDARASLQLTDGEVTFGSFELAFFAEDTGDDGERFLEAILDEEFSVDGESSVTQDDVATDIYDLSRGRDRLSVSIGQGGDFEGVLLVAYDYTDGTGQAGQGAGAEHAWIDDVSLPEAATLTRVSSGFRPPFVSFFEPNLELVRSLSADIPAADVDALVAVIRDGDLVDDVELRVDNETGDLEDGLSFDLRTSRDQPVRVSLFPSGLDDGHRLSIDAPIEQPDLDIGSALDDAPEPEDA